jgi:CubicO group peptidase (beta-lactamase class C family)
MAPCSLLAIAVFLSALKATAPDSPINSLFAPLIDAKSPGAAVLIRKNGHTVFSQGYRLADLRTSASIDDQTNFRLASVSKQFTAMAIMLLVHDGKLRYDQNLAEIFPGFPAYGRAITVRHLLNHTSGLADYETLMEAKEKTAGPIWSTTKQIRDDEVFVLLAQQEAGDFAPGTNWAYSNSGYVVLGLIVAKISGLPFPEFLQRRMFVPLQMSHTIAYVNGQNTIRHRAYGYSKKDGHFIDTDQSSTSATLGDGGIYSNLRDLARWDEALASNKLLSKAQMAPAADPVPPKSYGFGWFLNPIDRHSRMWHAGETSGFRTVIERFPTESLSIVILCNRTDLDPADLAEKIVPRYF